MAAVDKSKQLYRVNRVEDAQQYSELQKNLDKSAAALEAVKKPVIGQIYAVEYGGHWYKGLTVSLDPLMIGYITKE